MNAKDKVPSPIPTTTAPVETVPNTPNEVDLTKLAEAVKHVVEKSAVSGFDLVKTKIRKQPLLYLSLLLIIVLLLINIWVTCRRKSCNCKQQSNV